MTQVNNIKKIKKMKQIHFIALWMVLLLYGCASITGYNDGRSLGEGKFEFTPSFNVTQSPDFDQDITVNNIVVFPNIELGGKYGVTEKLDALIRFNTSLNFNAGIKYQLVGDRTSSFALGTGLEFGTFGFVTSIWNVQVPLYGSLHPSDMFTFYFSPRYIYLFSGIESSTGINYFGGNVGMMVGRKHKFCFDLGYYGLNSNGLSSSLSTIGMGGKFVFGGKDDDGTDTKTEFKSKKKKKKRR